MEQHLEQSRTRELNPWTVVLAVVLLILVLGAIGGYAFDWGWTGFKGNTLWDWLNLLLLPVVLTVAMTWFTLNTKISKKTQIVLVRLLMLALVLLVVCIIGGYAFNWTWTGFKGNTLWDWLKLLLVPFALPALTTWYTTVRQNQASDMTSKPQAQHIHDLQSTYDPDATVRLRPSQKESAERHRTDDH